MKKLVLALLIAAFGFYGAAAQEDPWQAASDSVVSYLREVTSVKARPRIEKTKVTGGKLRIDFSRTFSDFPLRDSDIKTVYSIIDELIPSGYAKYRGKTAVYGAGQPIEVLSSAYYSGRYSSDAVKQHAKLVSKQRSKVKAPLVRNLSHPYSVTKGLQDRHIALWQSHGFYYEPDLQRWEWQRARIFETVEDLYTQSYVLPFLVPMLENAGAVALMPRERDFQKNEVIVDNDAALGYSETGAWTTADSAGFANPQKYYTYKENPFKMGTARVSVPSKKGSPVSARWTPDIPESGRYGVYVSYQTVPESSSAARYTVYHRGGQTEFSVNQQMGGGTWIFLGYFDFDKGYNPSQGVVLTGASDGKTVISADAVKFGGGMGNIAREPLEEPFEMEPEISGYPRFTEGSRYWLQWAGFNDTIYSWTLGKDDYTDDYVSRGRWVNTLSDGSYVNPKKKGYNIPLDLSFAFHTDAGTTLDDSIIGTLSIYTKYSNDKDTYSNGESRMAGRELADIVQTQLVDDVRALYEPQWSRRYLWDRSYSESRTPEVPAMLLEFLSHQNLADMRYGLDPSFRFTVSRAIYKGMLKFLAYLNDFEYVVQPLPVSDFAADIAQDEAGYYASLSWQGTVDPLEPSAISDKYVVYTRIDDGAFDNGVVAGGCNYRMPIEPGHIYSFKVGALNAGGESFPSEVLALGVASTDAPTALIVNNFDRVSAPVSFASPDSCYAGFMDKVDAGLPYLYDISYIGAQHEFRRHIPWMDDDSAGFGASDADYETVVVAGNTFDYPYVHGKALMAAGVSFASSSRSALIDGCLDLESYAMLDVICGKQVSTQVGRSGSCPVKYEVFTPEICREISEYASHGGKILVSGSNIASDSWEPVFDVPVSSAKDFVTNVLKFKWMTNSASARGTVRGIQNPFGLSTGDNYSFYTKANEKCYAVESADGIVPAGPGSWSIMRYAENNISAGVAFEGEGYKVVALGFPIETLTDEAQIELLMSEVVEFFQK